MSVAIITTAVVISIVILTYFGTISVDVGIVLSILSLVVPSVSTAIGYFRKPKVALEIKNIQFIKSLHAVEGYQLKAFVTNNGRKICQNLAATFQIRDAQDAPNLLYVSIVETDGHESITTREAPMTDGRYTWIDEKGGITLGVWKELRLKDTVGLLFPYVTMHVGSLIMYGSSSSSSLECLLKLETNVEYHVVIEIKGEDSEKNTIMRSKKAKIRPLS